MRLAVAAAARLSRSLFPFTFRGLAIFLLAVGLCTMGIVRADLAGLFWGSSFLLFTAYALAAGHILLFSIRRRRTPDSVRFHLPTAGLLPGEQYEAFITARLPRSFPPGFSVHLSLPLSWHGRRVVGIRQRTPRGSSQAAVTFRASHRGVYEGAGAVLEAHDVLGLTAHRLAFPRRDRVTVYPVLRPVQELAGLVERTDEEAADSPRRRRSEELLEARKYYPGDDVRRLNWKVFAHMDELFLRVGEEVPPPESRILFVLDTTSNPLVPRAVAADYLDALVESCASVMARLMDHGSEVTFSCPGTRECRSFGEESRSALLAALAEAWWTTEAWEPDLPARALQAVVFSSPGSPALAGIMSTVTSRDWGARLFFQDLPPRAPGAARRVRDFFFLRRGTAPARRSAVPRKRDLAAFADALERDIASYHGAAQRVGHAAGI
ncbi:MAG: DUF58 domain-containing protein [Spirochaetia bacterium]